MALTPEDLQAIQILLEPLREETKKQIKALDEKLEANNEVLLRGVNVIVENKYDEILKLLREDYSPVATTARNTARKTADYDEVKSTVNSHQHALENHNQRITKLEKKAI